MGTEHCRKGCATQKGCRVTAHQQCSTDTEDACLYIVQVMDVELRNGFAPHCDINGLGDWGIRLYEHHPQVLVYLHTTQSGTNPNHSSW